MKPSLSPLTLSVALALTLGTVVGTFVPAGAGSEPPAWLVAASKVPTPERSDDAPAVELLRECKVRVKADGTFLAETRRAVRILTREGREHAVVREYYESGAGSVQGMQAWIMKPSGGSIAYGAKHAVDLSMVGNDLYSEGRVRGIAATDDAEVGSVFGSESVVEFRQQTLQERWAFQDRLPVVASTFAITVPAGWNLKSVTFNHPPIEPRREGEATVWSTGGLPYLEEENWSPPLSSLAPRIAVTIVPPASESRWSSLRIEDWASVARWMEALAEPQSATTPALVAKARALVEGRTGEWDRIDAIARYVQGLQYVSVQTGVARGGGYRPHPAADVFAKSYGDCKGKANLLLTMLREVGIRSYLVLITADDPDLVREEWPSPYQFNHCINAIAVSDTIRAPAAMKAGAGRILLFDATASATPLGQLPYDEQGSLALLVAGGSSELIRVPASTTAENGSERTVEGRVGADGALTAKILLRTVGREATRNRMNHRSLSPEDFRKGVEALISGSAPGASLSSLEVKDDFRANRFVLEIGIHAPAFARRLPGGLLALKPLTLESQTWHPRSAERSVPLLLPSWFVSETTVLQVPDGFVPEECSDPIRTETPFGTFQASCELDGAAVRFRRELDLKRTLMPAGEITTAARFFESLRSAGQTSVVLAPVTRPAPASSR
jgi:transglutaminase-like putative cysteine protease